MIPYMIMICLIGMPLLFMEYGFGQYFGVGSLSIYKKVCPMFQGRQNFVKYPLLIVHCLFVNTQY